MSEAAQIKIYVASSWRNTYHSWMVGALREEGFSVYDFRNPPNKSGFSWSEIDLKWKEWKADGYIKGLEHYRAVEGFQSDICALASCDACVLLYPCGASAHMEAGIAIGASMPVVVAVPKEGPREPELMILAADSIVKFDKSIKPVKKALDLAIGNEYYRRANRFREWNRAGHKNNWG